MPEDRPTPQEEETKRVVDQLYAAFLAADLDGMLETMSADVWVRFLGLVDFRGIHRARRFFGESAGMLVDPDFRIRKLLVDGGHAAALWEETARTVTGHDWANHGVDVFEVRDGRIVSVHENKDVNVYRRHFPAE